MKYILPLFLLFVLASCADDDSLELKPNFNSINNDLFAKSCATVGCHTGTTGLNLDSDQSFENLVSKPSSTGLSYVRISDSDNSYLIHKLEGRDTIDGSRMPLNKDAISKSNIDAIKKWIDDGANP